MNYLKTFIGYIPFFQKDDQFYLLFEKVKKDTGDKFEFMGEISDEKYLDEDISEKLMDIQIPGEYFTYSRDKSYMGKFYCNKIDDPKMIREEMAKSGKIIEIISLASIIKQKVFLNTLQMGVLRACLRQISQVMFPTAVNPVS